jgi:hypothetical protein
VIDPPKACQPFGAVFAATGFAGTLPFVHGSVEDLHAGELLKTHRFRDMRYSLHAHLPIRPEHFDTWLGCSGKLLSKCFRPRQPNARSAVQNTWRRSSRQACFMAMTFRQAHHLAIQPCDFALRGPAVRR